MYGEKLGAKPTKGTISAPSKIAFEPGVLEKYQELYARLCSGDTKLNIPGEPEKNDADNYYPPRFREAGILSVAMLTDNTISKDGFLWIKQANQHHGISSPQALKLRLEMYGDNSIDLLVISGHCAFANTCGVGSSGGVINKDMKADVLETIRRKVKLNGIVVLAACETGEKADQKAFATALQRKLSAAKGLCRGLLTTYHEWGLGGWAEGGYNTVSP